MKNIWTIILLMMTLVGFSQNGLRQLPKPNLDKIGSQMEEDYRIDFIYHYLQNNFSTESKVYNKAYLPWKQEELCSFEKEFQYGIIYKVHNCIEAGGVNVTVTFPKINKRELMNWVENMHAIHGDLDRMDQNQWSEDMMIYEPIDMGAGCYYRIIEHDNNYEMEMYCGC